MSSPELTVRGGAGGIEAELADLVTLARSSADLAEVLAATSAACHGLLLDPDLLASALLHPAGVARVQATLADALDGPRGLTVLAITFTARGVALEAAALAYEAADAALAELADDLHWAAGFLAPVTVPALLAGLAGGAVADPAGSTLAVVVFLDDPERWLTEHPGVVDAMANMAPGLAGALVPGLPWLGGGDVRAAAGRLGGFWPDGRPVVTRLPDDTSSAVITPPRGIADHLRALDARNTGTTRSGQDQIGVRVITHADGTTAYVVDIPGTRDWTLPGGGPNPATNDLGTSVRVLGGDATTRQAAVAEALRQAGASATDPVMLVGHSQGGMVAAQAAHDAGTAEFDFTVTHLITAGAPVARAGIPESVQVLALENATDVVPHLDGRANDDDPNVTTVTFDLQNGGIGPNHAIGDAYRVGARAVDRSEDSSIAAYRASADAFLVEPGEEATVVGQVYSVSRR
ncbi:alpha/beta hydrolase [Blastococcus sp. CCUG 61487]|uniref:PGAP1-like alpha/beta domain-containing protein n=1 Tax=Blastococcus sp. CCUG 61487 TaxID=1840703 RepID=UPI0010C0298A|nr:alpha/beta hydrolase [Blastococcus sp. CCUG 61487]TKJ25724.1 hypothetical protein A6V29_03945 [Blastococcus sp. CCUG 61487]